MMLLRAVYVLSFCVGLLVSQQSLAQGVGCAAGYDCSERGIGDPGAQCSMAEWENALVGQESGGSYTIPSTTSSALGRYQFIDGTRSGIGSANGFPCASGAGSREGFASCPGLQDDYAVALWAQDLATLESCCTGYLGQTRDGVEVTMSGLVAMAHNVGAGCARQWAQGGRANMTIDIGGTAPCTDANGTDPVQHYAAAMGGFGLERLSGNYGGNGSCGEGQATPQPAHASNRLLGCDPAVLEQNETIVDAMNERDMQVAKSMITQPASIAQTTCTDQHIQTQSAAGGILSNLPGGNISETMGPLIEQPFIQNLTSNFMSANPLGSLQSMINNSYTQVVEEFNTMMSGLSGGLLGGLGGGAGASGGCDMMNESWLLSQCIQMPKFPSVNDILNGALENVTGAVTDLINSPFKALDQVCQGMSDKLGDYTNSLTDTINSGVDSITSPITDTLGEATGNITDIGN